MKDMHKIAIIGNGSVGTCLTEKIKDLDKEITVVQNENILSQGNDVYQFKNYHFLDSRSPSKSRLKNAKKDCTKRYAGRRCGGFIIQNFQIYQELARIHKL